MIENRGFASVVRWAARVLGAAFVILFLVIGIGEISADGIGYIELPDLIMMIMMPCLLFVGIILGWWRPVLGGYIIILSVLLFNLAGVILRGDNGFLNLEFGWLVILGLLYIISSKR